MVWAGTIIITAYETLQTASNPFVHVPNGWIEPSTVVVVGIWAVLFKIIGSVQVILAQIEVFWSVIIGRWQQFKDIETPRTPQNLSYLCPNVGRGPLRRWVDVLKAPRTDMPTKEAPTGRLLQFDGSEAGFLSGMTIIAAYQKPCRPPQISLYMSYMDGSSLPRWYSEV